MGPLYALHLHCPGVLGDLPSSLGRGNGTVPWKGQQTRAPKSGEVGEPPAALPHTFPAL